MAMVIVDVPAVGDAGDPERALFTLAVLTGVVMLAAGLLRLGSLLRFVSNAVMSRSRTTELRDVSPATGRPASNAGAEAKHRLPYGCRTTTSFAGRSSGGSVSIACPSASNRRRRIDTRLDWRATGKLVVVSVGDEVRRQLEVAGIIDVIGPENVYSVRHVVRG